MHDVDIIVSLSLLSFMQLTQFFYSAAHRNVSAKRMSDVLSPDMRRQMELTG